jgi:outer membrane protein insertion porin family
MRSQVNAPRPCAVRSVASASVLAAALLLAPAVVMAETRFPQVLPQLTAQVTSPATSSIVVEGNRRIEAETIRTYFHVRPGGRLDAATMDAALKDLLASGLFQDVRIRQAGDRVIVTVVENPVINRVAFEGNKSLKDDQLRGELQSKQAGPLSRATVQSDVVRVTDLFRRSGRFDVRVEPKIIELPNQRVDLVFEVQEGVRTGIKHIVFVGNKAYSSQRLKQVIKSGETNLLSFLLSNDLYDPDRIEVDRSQLRRFYLSHGYPDIRIVSAEATYDPDRKGLVATYTIDEGNRHHIGTVNVQSAIPSIDPSPMRAKMRTSPGDVFNAEAVEKSAEDITIELAKGGQPFAVVRPQVVRDRRAATINLVYRIEEGSRSYVEQINIRGNLKTQDHVIRREFDLSEGDAYNRALVARAERRLKNLGYFKNVKITTEPGSTPDRVIVNVALEEQNTGEFSVGGGYSTSDGFIGEVSVGERNLFGSGLYVRASGRYGDFTKGIDLSVTEPYIMGSRVSAGVNLFAKQSTTSSFQSFGSESFGGALTLATPLSEQIGTQYRYSLVRQRITLDPALTDCTATNPAPGCLANGEASLPIKQAALAGAAWVSSIGYTLSYNTLDNIRNPTSGIRSDFRQDLAGVGGDVKFLKSTEDFRYYHEVGGDAVAMVRAQGGYVTPWGGQQLPLLNSFFGGPDLVRGFAVNGFGPRDITDGTSKDNVGGTRYWATTAELRTPIPWIPPESGLRVAVFADAGSLWGFAGTGSSPSLSQSFKVADSKTIRSSMGAGLIWDSPFGPMRVDYAYPTSKAAFDVTQRLRFSAWGF